MPCPFDPNQTFELPCEPEGCGKSFTVRYMSVRAWQTYARLLAEAKKLDDDNAYVAAMLEAFAMPLVGWTGFGAEWKGPESLLDVFTVPGLMEFAMELPSRATIGEIDRKKSERQSPSAQGQSATDATAATAAGSPPPPSTISV